MKKKQEIWYKVVDKFKEHSCCRAFRPEGNYKTIERYKEIFDYKNNYKEDCVY